MDRDLPDPDQTNSISGNIGRGLAEVRDALSREERVFDDEETCSDVTRAVRRYRGVIVLTTFVAAVWLGIAGVVSAATREAPFSELTMASEHEAPFVAAAALPGPIEWPTIAIAPRKQPVKPRKKH